MQGLKTLLGQEADLRKIEPNLYLNEKLRREVCGFQFCTSAAIGCCTKCNMAALPLNHITTPLLFPGAAEIH